MTRKGLGCLEPVILSQKPDCDSYTGCKEDDRENDDGATNSRLSSFAALA